MTEDYSGYEEHKVQTFDDYLAMLRRSYHMLRKLDTNDPNDERVKRRVATAVSYIVEEIYSWNKEASGWDNVGDAVLALDPPPYRDVERLWALQEVEVLRAKGK